MKVLGKLLAKANSWQVVFAELNLLDTEGNRKIVRHYAAKHRLNISGFL